MSYSSLSKKEYQILSGCESLFRNGSIFDLSMDEISSIVEVTKMTIYKYFLSKENLLERSFLYYLNNLMNIDESIVGISYIERVLMTEEIKSILDETLINEFVKNSSDSFTVELNRISVKSLSRLNEAFYDSQKDGYLTGLTFEDFLTIFTLFKDGYIKNKSFYGIKQVMRLFREFVMKRV